MGIELHLHWTGCRSTTMEYSPYDGQEAAVGYSVTSNMVVTVSFVPSLIVGLFETPAYTNEGSVFL